MLLSDEKFSLKLDDFQANVISTFHSMRDDTEFTDVTLACDGNQRIEAHRVILAASSPFFSNILKENNKHPHPFIYMRGVKESHLVAILDFIYHGEVNIEHEDLEEFMLVGEELQIKGLETSGHKSTKSKNPTKSKCDTIIQPKSEPKEGYEDKDIFNNGQRNITNTEDLDREINSLIQKAENKGFSCKMCGIKMSTTQSMRNHIEGKHIEGFSHPCMKCETGKNFKTRHSLAVHNSQRHRNVSIE